MVKRYLGIGVGVVLAALAACNSDSDSTATCATLTECCTQLTDASSQAECTSVATAGDESNCADAQSDFEGSGVAGSTCTMVSTSTSAPTGCAGLTMCCGQITTATEQAVCDEIVAAADDTTCTAELTTYEGDGMCKAPVTVTTTATGCAGLMSCCASASATDQAECDEYVTIAAGSDTTCGTYLTALQDQGVCGSPITSGTGTGTTGACSSLSTCCAALSADEQPTCDSVVSDGDETVCSDEAEVYCEGTPSSTSTESSDGGCSALSSCCSSLSSEEQAGCTDIVSEGVAADCSAALTSYMDDSLCN